MADCLIAWFIRLDAEYLSTQDGRGLAWGPKENATAFPSLEEAERVQAHPFAGIGDIVEEAAPPSEPIPEAPDPVPAPEPPPLREGELITAARLGEMLRGIECARAQTGANDRAGSLGYGNFGLAASYQQTATMALAARHQAQMAAIQAEGQRDNAVPAQNAFVDALRNIIGPGYDVSHSFYPNLNAVRVTVTLRATHQHWAWDWPGPLLAVRTALGAAIHDAARRILAESTKPA